MTAVLADTHALLWWLAADRRLSDGARAVIEAGEAPVHFSAASVWEAEIKAASGKLVLRDDLLGALEADGFLEIAIAARHTHEAARLPPLHRDPFDRMIVAQASLEGFTVVTRVSEGRRVRRAGALVGARGRSFHRRILSSSSSPEHQRSLTRVPRRPRTAPVGATTSARTGTSSTLSANRAHNVAHPPRPPRKVTSRSRGAATGRYSSARIRAARWSKIASRSRATNRRRASSPAVPNGRA